MSSHSIRKETAEVGPVFYLPSRIVPLEKENRLFTVHGTTLSPSILLITEGTGRIGLEGVEKEARRGSVVLCGDGVNVRLSGFLRGLLIEYAEYGRRGEASEALFETRRLEACSPRIVRAAEDLAGSWHSRLAQEAFRTQRLFLELLELLAGECRLSDGAEAEDWLPRMLDVIHEQYAEEWTRQRAAELAGVTEEHFSRSFRRRTGYTFVGYLTLLRVRRVQRGLLQGDGSVQELALRVGYRGGSDLSRAFKRTIGSSPLHYKQAEKRIAAFNLNYTACLLALGVRPVLGAYSGWMYRIFPDLPPDQRSELSIYGPEECRRIVQEAKPDVLIGYDHLTEEREWLTIVPTVGISFMEVGWREQLRQIAVVAGKSEEAEALLARYARKVRQVNRQLDVTLGERGTAIVWEIGKRCAYTFGTRFGRAAHFLYDDLGFRFPALFPEAETSKYGYAEVPLDRLGEFRADHLFVIGAGKRSAEQLRSLFGADNGCIHVLGPGDLFYGFDPLSTLGQLHALEDAFAARSE